VSVSNKKNNGTIEFAAFDESDLVAVGQAPPPEFPPLTVGSRCRFWPDCEPGSDKTYEFVVIGERGDDVLLEYDGPDGLEHFDMPRICVRRVPQ